MRVFMTGATGFAGSQLVDLLVDEGHEVHALVHQASGHQPLPTNKNLHLIIGDLLNLPGIKEAIELSKPDTIFHLAGQASPSQSWFDPAKTIAINTGGTASILKAALGAGAPQTVVVTSAQIYGQISSGSLPITEGIAPDPTHPYGISKWAAGQLVR